MKSFLRKFFIISIELAIITGALWFIAQRRGINPVSQIAPALEEKAQEGTQEEVLFPEPAIPEEKSFKWKFKGVNYSLSVTLYGSTYDYYRSLPKAYIYSGELPSDWESRYYAMFLNIHDSDKSIVRLAEDLQSLGKKHKLSESQIVDLALSFVQSIPYDDAKAKNILAKDGSAVMLHPYEVLWKQTGVCSDKSLLAYSILREMGYGSALFIYDQNNHMAVAVECPENHSTYKSGYCYAETTSSGNKIGIIPSIDTESNKTVDLASYDPEQIQRMNLAELGEVKIFLPTHGKQYFGIIETRKVTDEIISLKEKIAKILPDLKALKKTIGEREEKLEDMEDDMNEYKDRGDVDKYNELVEKFNELLEKYKKDVKEYNEQASLYNGYIKKYNSLIKQ